MRGNILVVEDDRAIADLIELFLTKEKFRVFKFYNGQDALKCVADEKLDLAILDVMLPDLDGFVLCRRIRETHNFPIIMLTAKDSEIDKITGLTLGADDYITKPFRPLEMVARVKAQLRRFMEYNSPVLVSGSDSLVVRGLVMNRKAHECILDEKRLILTATEFDILWLLASNRGTVFSAEEIFRKVWDERYLKNSNNTVMVHVRHIREKMGDTGTKHRYIKTVWGVGYKIED